MDLRLPHHLLPSTWIVFEGPAQAEKAVVFDKLWRAAYGLGLGPKPLFDRVPVFTDCPENPMLQSQHHRDVVRAALDDANSVFMNGSWWTDVVDSGAPITRASAEAARHKAGIDRLPDVIFLLNPHLDPVLAPRYAALATAYSERVVVLTGHNGQIAEEMFFQLNRRGLYFAKRPTKRDAA